MLDKETKFHFLVSNFEEIESHLDQCLNFIPFIDVNKQVVSPKFIPLIIESCGLIESIFKEMEGNEGKKYSLKEYSELLEPYLDLEVAISIFLHPPIQFLNPFRDWTNAPPTWWLAYNKLKHDRLNNYDIATYENVILSMSGLHQVISRNSDFVSTLLIAGWFNRDSPDIEELITAKLAGARAPIHVIPVESKYFVTPQHDNFVVINNGAQSVEEGCDFSKRVRDILTVHEWL